MPKHVEMCKTRCFLYFKLVFFNKSVLSQNKKFYKT